jgi:gamma-glutamylcyclotransferase (GGCT)/AIG2-like uncharacterized protein YtfP
MNKVFVYGSLKSGGEIRGLNNFGDGAIIVGKAKTQYPDYEMSDLGSFPGVFLNGKFHIEGEVWEVDDETMEQLDAIEGYPDFYSRQQTHTTQGVAWMYYLDDKSYTQYKGNRGDNVFEQGDTLTWQK